ncbi:toprim domain-containing protein [Agrobacterium salinitolerans]|uniref:toprim domain-containing protein n=1 Tax=Agrobacterium salinitolerans TaxID=1183413 RepID=UPI0022B80C5A|nr:toprim domain-containing protein [Agrobacterium salinitolerans]MCZ7857066.1 toprim domain-containing protein [Agrobacterium salinitolerans]
MHTTFGGNTQLKSPHGDIIEEFVAAMASAGVHMDRASRGGPHPIADGKMHRADALGKKSKRNAHVWYVLYLDGALPAGAFGDHQAGIEDTWSAKKPSSMTAEEKRDLKDRMKKAAAAKEEARNKMHAHASDQAAGVLKATGKAVVDHAYLAKKGLPVFPGLRVLRSDVRYTVADEEEPKTARAGNLVVPIFSPDAQLAGLQFIGPDGRKLFLKGMKKEGNYHSIGKPPEDANGVILIAEGYATAARLHDATGYLTIAAFDAGNLVPVGKAIRKKYPKARLVFAADNDRMTVAPIENPGVTKAKEAAEAVSGRVSIPVFEDGDITSTDFDDLAQLFGLDRVRDAIEETVNPKAANRFDEGNPPPADYTDYGDFGDYSKEEGAESEAPPVRFGAGPVPLGHDDGVFFYWVPARGQVASLGASGHTGTALVGLAPLHFWEFEFPGRGKDGGVNWTAAANAMMRLCEKQGVFDPSRKVGRGVLIDRGRVVAHLGDRLRVDGETRDLALPNSAWIYTRRAGIALGNATPLSNAEGKALCALLTRLPWAAPDMGKLLAGAISVAAICAALRWRSHVWINGERGSGKSFVMEAIVGKILAGFSIAVQGETTEAGVRQALHGDVLPVIFDEIEGKGTEEDRRRVSKVLALARQASSSNGAPIVKGTVGGSANSYRVRSSFIFASIEKSGTHAADESRIVTLTLNHPGPFETDEGKQARTAEFEKFREDASRLLTDDFGTRLFLRSLSMVDTINKNAETFASAIAKMTGSRRLGDTLAQPLAGWLSLQSTAIISPEVAEERLRSWTWLGGAIERGATEADHEAAFAHLMQSALRLDGGVMRTVDELVSGVTDGTSIAIESRWEEALSRSGIRVKKPDHEDGRTVMVVALNHPVLNELYRGQPFTLKTLHQIPGAKGSKNPVRFAGWAKVRALEIDISHHSGTEKRDNGDDMGQFF